MEPVFACSFSDGLTRAYSHVDRLCLHLCFRLAHDCGLPSAHAEPLADLIARVGVAPDAFYLLGAALDILADEGFARHTKHGWESPCPCPPDDSAELQRQARAACSEATPIFELIERCHEHAVGFLTGREPGLAAIFQRSDISLWERVHTVDRVMSIYADFLVPVLEAIAGRRMRLLELGAGVGAVLQRCLSLLDRVDVEQYCFTDLGQSFLQSAQGIYAGQKRIRFARVDLNLPLRSQGLLPESFDAVIAVNVLHVAKNLCFSLREIYDVLKMRGYLILAEGSPPDCFRRWRLDVIFAFLRGWWDVSVDPVLRRRPGFLLPSEWQKALLACGFDSVYLLPGEDWFRGPCRGGVVIAGKQTPMAAGESYESTREVSWAI
jgi:SAM-dependent methyltransferase